ncbi:PREDICTED: apoptosis inhibitor 5 [Chaetura pelagica]|nr:PREDICTED: apoptosis inhibitor 5 [Chaetura pelagica]
MASELQTKVSITNKFTNHFKGDYNTSTHCSRLNLELSPLGTASTPRFFFRRERRTDQHRWKSVSSRPGAALVLAAGQDSRLARAVLRVGPLATRAGGGLGRDELRACGSAKTLVAFFLCIQYFQHKDAYQAILDGVKGGAKEKRLAAQFIPKFFKHFPELADSAINAQLDLCEDEDVSIRRQAIKELPQFATGDNLPRVADILTQLLQSDDSAEFNLVNNALLSIFKMDAKGTLGGLFSQILQGEDIVRERAIKFLSTKLKTLPEEVMTKEVEDFILTESKKVLEDVTGEEFVLFMKILSGLKSLQTVSGRQQLVELVAEQADLEQTFNPSDPDCVDRLLQCTRQAVPLFSKNVHSTKFVTYFCEHVLPNLSSLSTPVEGLDIQLEVLKLLAEMSSFCGDMEKLESNLKKLFDKLLEYMPLPPEEAENGENAGNEEPKLQFSYVECLLYSFHQLGRKLPDFLTAKLNAEKLKDFKIRLQYFARGLQVYIRQLRLALQGKTGEALKTEENKIKVVALKITNNINVLIKDLFHIPPSYKSTVTLSWKPVQKADASQKRASEDTTSSSPPKKASAGPKRDARQIYNPPSGKYSSNLGSFSYEQRGGFRGGRGRGWGGRGNRSRGRIY